jgi:hypothetical protein
MPRGGKRPGAGAPRGNLNGLKNGRYSRQVKALRIALSAVPLTADVVRRADAAGEGKRILLARALHHLAELILLGSPEVQSKDPADFQQLLIRGFLENESPIRQSNAAPPAAEEGEMMET